MELDPKKIGMWFVGVVVLGVLVALMTVAYKKFF